jgi:hypothetical protein
VQSRASCSNFINSHGPNQILSNFIQIRHLEPSLVLIQISSRILKCSNKKSYSLFISLQIHILFGIFWVRIDLFWIELIRFRLKSFWINQKEYYSFRPATTAPSAAHTPSSLPCTGPLRTSSVAPPDSHHLHHVRALPASGPLHQQSCHPDPPSPRALHGLPAIRGLTPFFFFFFPPPPRASATHCHCRRPSSSTQC